MERTKRILKQLRVTVGDGKETKKTVGKTESLRLGGTKKNCTRNFISLVLRMINYVSHGSFIRI